MELGVNVKTVLIIIMHLIALLLYSFKYNNMKAYYKRKEYWEAAIIVWWRKVILKLPKYKYGWWESRLQLIKEGEI